MDRVDVTDLHRLTGDDLLKSVGRGNPGAWLRVGQYLAPGDAWIERIRPEIEDALRIRAARRVEGLETERARAASRRTAPAPALRPLWSWALEVRAALRQRVVPEGQHAQLGWETDPDRGLVGFGVPERATDWDRPRVVLSAIEPFTLDGSHPEWSLAAIDRLLDAIADPADPLHAEVVAVVTRAPWERELAAVDRWSIGAPPDETRLGWRVAVDTGALKVRPVVGTPRAKGGWTIRNARWPEVEPYMYAEGDERLVVLIAHRPNLPRELGPLVAEALIGHPRLFSGTKGNKPLVIRRRSLGLGFGDVDGRYVPTLTVDGEHVPSAELAAHVEHGSRGTWLRVVPGDPADELQWIPVPATVAAGLADWVRSTRGLPPEALQPLLARLPALSAAVPVSAGALSGTALAPDERPVV
ncbi:MAG: hypothetical protein ABMB14_40435, partial [Myxococcota bacterium]